MVGGKHNTMWMFTHLTHLMLSSATLSNKILFILIENLVVCVHTTIVDCNLFNNNRNKKVVGGNYNVSVFYKNASAPDPEGVVPLSNEIFCCVYIATC